MKITKDFIKALKNHNCMVIRSDKTFGQIEFHKDHNFNYNLIFKFDNRHEDKRYCNVIRYYDQQGSFDCLKRLIKPDDDLYIHCYKNSTEELKKHGFEWNILYMSLYRKDRTIFQKLEIDNEIVLANNISKNIKD